MTITLTDQMWKMWDKIEPYLVYVKGTGYHLREGTPKEIIELDKEFDRLYQKQYEFELSLL